MSAEFEQLKRSSVLQLLFKTGRLAEEDALERIRRETGLPNLRRAHMACFPHIDLAGTRLTAIAERMGLRKQSVAALVEDLVVMQMLERVPDPSDRRAKLVCFKGGTDALAAGVEHLIHYERELAARLGEDTMKTLHSNLLALEAALLGARS
ncbi:MAG: DNA-binding MarR family transcriptional regulator [Bradymonadia bacterium]|jgi:DNA-binding MarR family transcriptional regulator